MLTQLNIRNFAIVRELEIDFKSGMTCVTGETGAGKSIAIDALSLCLGGRADAASVRTGESKAEITACFDVSDSAAVKAFLDENDLQLEDSGVIIRRIITADGKSKAYINGTATTLAQLKALGELLVIIHGQHAHQLLFKQTYQTAILDKYADLADLKQKLGAKASLIKSIETRMRELAQNQAQFEARRELLEFQIAELTRLEPREGEYQELDQEYNRLANAGELISSCAQASDLLTANERTSALAAVQNAIRSIEKVEETDPGRMSNVLSMLSEAEISIQESYDEIREYADGIECDPQRMSFLEKRIALYDSLGMKYHVAPEELFGHLKTLEQEF